MKKKKETFLKIILLSLVVLEFHLLKILPYLSMGTSTEGTKRNALALGGNPPATDSHLQQASLLCGLSVESEVPKGQKAPALGSLLREGGPAWVLSTETSTRSNPSNPGTYLPPGMSEEKGHRTLLIRAEGRRQGASFSPLRKRKFLSRTFYKPESFERAE